MNKLGMVTGFVLAPFLLLMFMPWGRSTLPLYLFDTGTQYVGIWGMSPAGAMYWLNINFWWFSTTNLNRILCGAVFWFFTLFAMFLCFIGANQPEERGKKMYIAAFFLLMVVIVLLFVDGLSLGPIILDEDYLFMDFVARLQPGFYIFAAATVLVLVAGITYKEA
ncbi:MAG: hypothetical protein JW839_22455 [Candidatus Lokiarchaeota archaeon]|nr:hypothetical protein [Candidatus Lokiarchaeota archaeon]